MSRRATGRALPCGAARSRRSSTTATRASASPSTSASSAGTPAPRISRRKRSATPSRQRSRSRASPPPTRLRALPSPALIARSSRDLDLFHPWELPVEEAIALATASRGGRVPARPAHRQLRGCERLLTQQSQFIAGNSAGFLDGFASSRHYVSCAVIAAEGDAMQRDDWYSSQRAAADLATPEAIGDYAGRRALARLRGRKLGKRKAPRAVRGAGRERPPRALRLRGERREPVPQELVPRSTASGTQVFSPLVNLREEPHLPRGQASACFDDDGVATAPRDVVEGRRGPGVFPRRLLGAQARDARRPATPAATTI